MTGMGKHPFNMGLLKSTSWLLAFWLVHGPMLQAGVSSFRMTRLNSKQGLSENHVYCIAQDHKGFLWFGTRDGLNRYDGYEMRVYRNHPDDAFSLSNNYIYSLFEDGAGILWIGTRGGLNRFDREQEKFTHYRHSVADETSISHDTVNTIVAGAGPSLGQLWIGTAGGGACRFNPKTGLFHKYRHHSGDPNSLSNNNIRQIVVAPDGTVWFATEDGLNRMGADEEGRFTHYKNEPGNSNSLTHNKINSLFLDEMGTLWLGNEMGVDKLDTGDDSLVRLHTTDGELLGKISFLSGTEGLVWIGSSSKGFYCLDTVTGQLERWENDTLGMKPLNQVGLHSFYQDKDGTLWLGTYGNGVLQILRVPFSSKGSSNEVVSSLVKDGDGGLWIGKRGAGLEYRDSLGQRTIFKVDPKTPFSLPYNDLTVLQKDSHNRLWIGTGVNGLCYYDQKTHKFGDDFGQGKEAQGLRVGWIGSLAWGPRDQLWVGSDEGLKLIDLAKPGRVSIYAPDTRDPYSLSGPSIPSLYIKPGDSETLWIGTWNGGLNRMNLNAPGCFTNYKHIPGDEASLSANGVLSINQDAHGFLWLGTTGGLSRFDPATGKAHSYFIRDGLPSNTIYRMEEDFQGFVWVSTPRGLSRFDPRTEEFRNYDANDGLSVEDFRENCGFREADGRLVFGGAGGWVSFDPSNLPVNNNPPLMAITGFKLDNRPTQPRHRDPNSPLLKAIEETERVELSYENRTVELHFAALHFTAPKQNQFAYRLEGFDHEWNTTDAENRRAIYTNLDPGTYYFKVKGSNKDGVWAEETVLEIVVPRPPWMSWWAYSLYGLAVASLIGGYLRFLHHKLEKQRLAMEHMRQVEHLKDLFSAQLEEKVQERTRQLVGTRKKLLEAARAAGMAEIASDVLHNMGNTLNSARISVHLIQERAAENRWLNLLERITTLLQDHRETLAGCLGEGVNADRVLGTLALIHRKLSSGQAGIVAESDQLYDIIQAIVATLRKQEEHVHTMSWFLEPSDLCKLLEEALGAVPELTGLTCRRNLERVPLIRLDPLKLLRVFSMLIQNAIEAIGERDSEEKGLLDISTWHRGDEVGLEIRDNGVGISEQVLSRVFANGFTTKPEHDGLGLHYSANAVKEMGGGMEVSSEGPGLGASIVLRFTAADKPGGNSNKATKAEISKGV